MIGAATSRAFQTLQDRQADVMRAFTPGAQPHRTDVAQSASTDFTPDPLSASAPRDSYFVVAQSGARFSFTRDGSFGIRDGALVDSSGRTVYGYRTASSALAPLRIEPVDVALGLGNDVRIQPDGNVTLSRVSVDPRDGVRGVKRETIGRIALARFAPGTALGQLDAAHFTAPPGVTPHFGRPADGNFATVTPQRREHSGIDIDAGLERLQEAYLAVDALRAADVANRGVEKTAMDLLK